ncbi:hypothetical protein H0H92_010527 [Tricholoma furcatifolium]|nr:hypothetical protein H0H92_010527 [Tricholoma furcatifolium]
MSQNRGNHELAISSCPIGFHGSSCCGWPFGKFPIKDLEFDAEPRSFRFDPIFVLPVSDKPPMSTNYDAAPISHTPGRRAGTGSANIAAPQKSTSSPISILGFQPVSLFRIITMTGQIPPFGIDNGKTPQSLEQLRQRAARPIVVFPECTTSNGRGLLRFAKVFHEEVPVKKYQVFVMCVRSGSLFFTKHKR